MLTMTLDAATLVSALVAKASLPAEGGVRIVTDSRWHSLSMDTAARPAAADTVVTQYGAHLFLSPSVATKLANRTLCAEITPKRSVFFLQD
jgi:hypothetical protein